VLHAPASLSSMGQEIPALQMRTLGSKGAIPTVRSFAETAKVSGLSGCSKETSFTVCNYCTKRIGRNRLWKLMNICSVIAGQFVLGLINRLGAFTKPNDDEVFRWQNTNRGAQ